MLSLSLTYGSCDDSLFFATFGEIKNGKEKKKCSNGGVISCFLNIQSNPPGLFLSSFLPESFIDLQRTPTREGDYPSPARPLGCHNVT